MPATNIKVVLVDDHPMLRSGVQHLMAQKPNISIVGEASTGESALKLVKELKPDLIVMDMHLPDMGGIEVTRQALELAPSMKVLVYSGDATRALVDDALQAGACGYVWKQGAVEELVRAIDMVMIGKLYLSPEVSADILAGYRKTLIEGPEPAKPLLSDREKVLLRLVAGGLRNKEIATQLAVSPKSVEAYRSRLMKKLGCASSADLVRYAIREGIASV